MRIRQRAKGANPHSKVGRLLNRLRDEDVDQG